MHDVGGMKIIFCLTKLSYALFSSKRSSLLPTAASWIYYYKWHYKWTNCTFYVIYKIICSGHLEWGLLDQLLAKMIRESLQHDPPPANAFKIFLKVKGIHMLIFSLIYPLAKESVDRMEHSWVISSKKCWSTWWENGAFLSMLVLFTFWTN